MTMIIALLPAAQILLFIFGWQVAIRREPGQIDVRLPLTARIILSFSLLLAAYLINLEHVAPYTGWVLGGMVLSFLGDLTMAEIIKVPNRLIGGMSAFGCAHILYIIAFFKTISAQAHFSFRNLTVGLIIYTLIILIGWSFLIRNPKQKKALYIGGLAYGLWIGIMASFALSLAITLGGTWWMAAAGALLFAVSDAIIGVTKIGGISFRYSEIWVWLTYVLGQMGIIYAGWFY
ncbi:MAG: lysoplasmalogenase [Dethiobacteria bacterium]